MDDANNEIYSAFFVEEEGTMSSFVGIAETIRKKGLFCSLLHGPGLALLARGRGRRQGRQGKLTQVGRALGPDRH